ncbi:odorant receptor 46a-like isoform X2 [Phymastichus coffea]|uniref:odorant receptor 46a-like isoform X2 n=1 Tax=Phymastichus coffea TaxID=108790 RepID=UPI00273A79FA|nr:odorant receptor 46a-like isoform X2 [Phymastichus coffea]
MKLKTERMGYEECVGVSRLLLSLIGVWPQSHGKGNFFKRNYVFVTPTMIFFILIVPQVRKLLYIWRDLNAVVDILSIGLIIVIICFLKFLRVWCNYADFNVLLKSVHNDWKIATENEQILMWKYARYSRLVATVSICSLLSNCHLLHTWAIVQYHFDLKSLCENETMDRPFAMEMDYYFDVQSTPVYEIMCLLIYLAIISACLIYAGYDSVFVLLMLHYTALFNNLRVKVENLVEDQMAKQCSFVDVLVPLINRHQYLCRYTSLVEKNFNGVFLVQILFTSIHLCLQGYEFVVVISKNGLKELPQLLFIIFYVFTSLFSLFIYCFISEQLRIQSGDLYTSIYKVNWYELFPYESKLLLLMMIRTENPVNITAGKFAILSLEYFCFKILRQFFFSTTCHAR